MRLGSLVAALVPALLAACGGKPDVPKQRGLPGQIWATPPQPYRLANTVTAMHLLDDHTAIVSSYGWLARVDLDKGLVTKEARIGSFAVRRYVALRDGRLLVVGVQGEHSEAKLLDPTTLATQTVITGIDDKDHYTTPGAVELPDGTVAIAGRGIPLGVYDATTWKVVRDLSEGHPEWSGPVLAGGALYSFGEGHIEKFDAASGLHATVAEAHYDNHLIGAGDTLVYNRNDSETTGNDGIAIAVGTAEPIHVAATEEDIALDATGTRAMWLEKSTLHIRTLGGVGAGTDKTIELGASARGQSVLAGAIGQHIAVFTTGPVLRVIDLDKTAVSESGGPPYAAAYTMTLRPDGTVVALGTEAWVVRDGRVASSYAIGDNRSMWPSAANPDHVGVWDSNYGEERATTLQLVSLEQNKPISSTHPDAYIIDGWMAADDKMLVETADSLAWIDGESVDSITPLSSDALVADVDTGTPGAAAVTAGGSVHVLELGGSAMGDTVLRVPGCEEYASAVIERKGSRIAVYDGPNLVVYERASSKVLGTATFANDLYDVQFVPGHPEIVVSLGDQFGTWTPGDADAQLVGTGNAFRASLSPTADRIAVSFADGHIALADYAKLRAGLKPTKVTALALPETCPEPSAFMDEGYGDQDSDGYDGDDSTDEPRDDDMNPDDDSDGGGGGD